MCGIFGFFLNRPLQEDDLELGRAGMEALRHRGPDDSGWWSDREAGVFLGHRRLSIIDLSSASHQPMVREEAVLAYNGELYNFRELRDELKARGTPFFTRGDTEVLLQAWRAWGSDALQRFDGMFAFALYHDRRLHLVTDPFGEKPLYWTQTSEGIYFASETGPLAKCLACPRDLTGEDVAAFLSLGFLPAPRTGYRNVSRLSPATHMVLESGAVRMSRQYWTPPTPPAPSGTVRPFSEREIDRLQGILIESLRRRVYSDAPLGIFLSSGTDSSLVAAIAVKDLGLKLQALTVAFPDGRDESVRAQEIARSLEVPHMTIDSREDPACVSPACVSELLGELNDNLTVAAVRHMALVASPYLKVALTGMGGDELFYGYGRYQTLYRYRSLFDLPVGMRQAISTLSGAVFPRCWPMRVLHPLLSGSDPCRIFAVKNSQASPWLWGLPAVEAVAQRLFSPHRESLPAVARAFDLAHTMPASYIPAMERGSMRASLEVRTPYLHRRLLDAISDIDPRRLLAFGQKSVLKRILARYLPQHLVEAPKQGFVVPQSRFLHALPPDAPRVQGISPARIQQVWRRRDQRGWQSLAVRLVMLEAWVQSQPIFEQGAGGAEAVAAVVEGERLVWR